MLVLTRRVGQEIRIGDGIRVRVVAITGNKIRLAVAAPRSISVDRQEVYLRRCGQAPQAGHLGRADRAVALDQETAVGKFVEHGA